MEASASKTPPQVEPPEAAAASKAEAGRGKGGTNRGRGKGKGNAGRGVQVPSNVGPVINPQQGPIPIPGAGVILFTFNSMNEEEKATYFDLNLQAILDFVPQLIVRIDDQLARMLAFSVAGRNNYVADIGTSLTHMVCLALGVKLMKTATSAQIAHIGVYNTIINAMNDVELPAPIMTLIDKIGNFNVDNELFRMDDLDIIVAQLFYRGGIVHQHWRNTILSDFFVRKMARIYTDETLRNIGFTLTNGASARMVPTQAMWDVATGARDPSFDVLLQDIEAGANLGQRDEVSDRSLISRDMLNGTIPPPAGQQPFVDRLNRTYNANWRFDTRTPAQIKQDAATTMYTYKVTYMAMIKRIWTTTTVNSFSMSGSACQLQRPVPTATVSYGPKDATPSDYAYLALVNLAPRILRRPEDSWMITQPRTRLDIQEAIFMQALKAQ